MSNQKKSVAKHYLLVSCLMTVMSFFSQISQAAITPYIIETKTLSFGSLIYVPGACKLAYNTQVITNLTSQNICTNSSGSAGVYRIFANPNKQVQIKLNSHSDSGNGILYVPDGQLVSDVASAIIIADTTQTINSGTSGIIDITIGGQLTISSILTPASIYNELFTITFVEI